MNYHLDFFLVLGQRIVLLRLAQHVLSDQKQESREDGDIASEQMVSGVQFVEDHLGHDDRGEKD